MRQLGLTPLGLQLTADEIEAHKRQQQKLQKIIESTGLPESTMSPRVFDLHAKYSYQVEQQMRNEYLRLVLDRLQLKDNT